MTYGYSRFWHGVEFETKAGGVIMAEEGAPEFWKYLHETKRHINRIEYNLSYGVMRNGII